MSLAFGIPIILIIISFIEKVDKYGFDWPRPKKEKITYILLNYSVHEQYIMGVGVLIVLVLTMSTTILLMPVSADARDNFDVGITLSKTCQSMIKNNFTTNCPTYEEILTLFPDTTNQQVSGEFQYIDGIYQRGPTDFKNHFNFYTYSDNVVWVEPAWRHCGQDCHNNHRVQAAGLSDTRLKEHRQQHAGPGPLALCRPALLPRKHHG